MPYTSFAVTLGALPDGLTLNTTTGFISGSPSTAGGPTSFTVTRYRLDDAGGDSQPGTIVDGTAGTASVDCRYASQSDRCLRRDTADDGNRNVCGRNYRRPDGFSHLGLCNTG